MKSPGPKYALPGAIGSDLHDMRKDKVKYIVYPQFLPLETKFNINSVGFT